MITSERVLTASSCTSRYPEEREDRDETKNFRPKLNPQYSEMVLFRRENSTRRA